LVGDLLLEAGKENETKAEVRCAELDVPNLNGSSRSRMRAKSVAKAIAEVAANASN
jgi:hypothetical protein